MCICSCSITIFYMRCLNVDRPLCFRTENIYGCFFASSSIDVEFSWVECEYECVCMCIWAMKFSLGFFPFLPTNIFNGYTSWERERERGMIKCAFKVSPKYGCLCPNRYEWKVQNSYLCTSVLNYIYCISLWGLPSHPPALFLPRTRIMYGARKKKNTNICHFISASSSWMASFVLCNTFNLLCCWPIFMAWHSLSHQIYKVKHKLNMLSVWQGFQQ